MSNGKPSGVGCMRGVGGRSDEDTRAKLQKHYKLSTASTEKQKEMENFVAFCRSRRSDLKPG